MKAHLANPHGADLNKYLKAGAPKPEFKRARANEPTVDQLQSDNLTALAKTYWAPQTKKNHVDFNPEVKKSKKNESVQFRALYPHSFFADSDRI